MEGCVQFVMSISLGKRIPYELPYRPNQESVGYLVRELLVQRQLHQTHFLAMTCFWFLLAYILFRETNVIWCVGVSILGFSQILGWNNRIRLIESFLRQLNVYP
jgi:hypothetical protein